MITVNSFLLYTIKSLTNLAYHLTVDTRQSVLDLWQLPEIEELCLNSDQGFVTNYMSAITHLHQIPRYTNDTTPVGDIDAVADHSRRHHRTAAKLQDLIRQIFPRHRIRSRVVNK